MRVALIVEQLRARVPGGTGRYTRGLVDSLVDTRASDDVLLGWATPGPDLGLPLGVRALNSPALLLPRLWERGIGPRPRGADVVHAPTLLVPPTSSARLVVTIHDVVPWSHPETLTPRGVGFHRRMGERAARVADLIVTPTQAVADAVTAVLTPRCPVEAVPPGLSGLADSASTAQPGGDADPGGASGPSDPHGPDVPAGPEGPADPAGGRPYVLFVGTLEPRKGLDVLAAAMADPRLRGIHLVCVGPSGWGGVSIEDLAAQAGIADRTHAAGYVADPELRSLYSAAMAVAMPSRAEGFGLPVLEAMAAGAPVVVSSDPALVEVAGGAAAVAAIGDVAALADVLSELADDMGLRVRMRGAGRARAATFSWTASAHRLWSLYRGLA